MAASPFWKVYNPHGEYVAACKHAEEAACLVAFLGPGAEIRADHSTRVRWQEGLELQPAHESYDFVATTLHERLDQRRRNER